MTLSRIRRALKRSQNVTLVSLSLCGSLVTGRQLQAAAPRLEWQRLPDLPDVLGVAGAFAGVSHDALLVAGGANFPDKMPWAGGAKTWWQAVYVLPEPGGEWQSGFKLPRPCAYGVSVSYSNAVVCIGGSDAAVHRPEVFLLEWDGRRVLSRELPRLPFGIAHACGEVLDGHVYVSGGIDAPAAITALRSFLSLDLAAPDRGWQKLEPWPGPGRMLASCAVANGHFYLLGGVSLQAGKDRAPVRDYLDDVYAFTPGAGWKVMGRLPRAVAAAPSPCPILEDCLFVPGGDDGSLLSFEPKSQHPGFPARTWCYSLIPNQWTEAEPPPAPRATLPVVVWRGLHVLVSGEVRPGVRSPEIWTLRGR